MTDPLVSREEFHLMGLTVAACAGVPSETIDAEIVSGCAKAITYLDQRYVAPILSFGPATKDYVCAIIALGVKRYRGMNPSNPADMLVVKAHDDAIAWLRDVVARRASADVVDSAATPAASIAARVISKPKRGWRC